MDLPLGSPKTLTMMVDARGPCVAATAYPALWIQGAAEESLAAVWVLLPLPSHFSDRINLPLMDRPQAVQGPSEDYFCI